MKVVFALVVLLHLCHSNDNNKRYKVYKEIIQGLNKLDQAKISLQTVLIPYYDMITDQSSFVSCYVSELKHLLGNVTVNKSNKHIIQGLQANLLKLELNPEVQRNCTLIPSPNIQRPFIPYKRFFRKLCSMK